MSISMHYKRDLTTHNDIRNKDTLWYFYTDQWYRSWHSNGMYASHSYKCYYMYHVPNIVSINHFVPDPSMLLPGGLPTDQELSSLIKSFPWQISIAIWFPMSGVQQHSPTTNNCYTKQNPDSLKENYTTITNLVFPTLYMQTFTAQYQHGFQ